MAFFLALYHGFILGFILGFMSLGRGVSVASVASGAVLATAGAHRGATPQLGNSGSIRKLYCHRNSILGVVQGGRSIPGHYSALFCALHMLYTPLRVCISVCLYSTQSIARPQKHPQTKQYIKTYRKANDSTVVFAFVLSYSKLYSALFLSIQG